MRHGRGGFMRGIGCFFVAAIVLSAVAGALAIWLIAASVGLVATSAIGRVGAIAGVGVGLLLIYLVARRLRSLARPVDDLVVAAGRVERGDFSVRVRERGPGDVRSLARAFNAMSARLDATERSRRAYLADVTHELRTPLTVIQAQLEAIQDGIHPADAEHMTALLDEVRTLDGLIEDLRTLTLVETGGLTLRREMVDLAELIADASAPFRAPAEAGRIRLTSEVAADVPSLSVDPGRLRRVLTNLLVNALRHTPQGGTVGISAVREADVVRIAVRNSGEGFADDVLPRAFERFAKGPGSDGSGLGLSIARDLVSAHGGTIAARNVDGGAVVEFTLPV